VVSGFELWPPAWVLFERDAGADAARGIGEVADLGEFLLRGGGLAEQRAAGRQHDDERRRAEQQGERGGFDPVHDVPFSFSVLGSGFWVGSSDARPKTLGPNTGSLIELM